MNYLEIVLQGYFNENNREFLEKYFFREFKKAEKEQFFEADEFFNGCIKVIESWEKYLQDKVFERKNELYLMLNGAKNSTMKYRDLQGKTIEQKRQETIEYCEQELKDVRPDGIGSLSFTVHLHSLTKGRIAYNLPYNELLEIKLSILKAFQKTQPQNEALPPQQTEKPRPKLTINQIALKYVYSEIRITRENANEKAKEYGHKSGEKLFQRFTFYSSAANRKGKPQPCTPKKLKNKIELLESVLEHLPIDKRNRIEDEISILKNIQEAEYL